MSILIAFGLAQMVAYTYFYNSVKKKLEQLLKLSSTSTEETSKAMKRNVRIMRY